MEAPTPTEIAAEYRAWLRILNGDKDRARKCVEAWLAGWQIALDPPTPPR